MNKRIEILYRTATRADQRFTEELTRVYGRESGDARYKWKHSDLGVEAAMQAKLAADKALWLAQCEAEVSS